MYVKKPEVELFTSFNCNNPLPFESKPFIVNPPVVLIPVNVLLPLKLAFVSAYVLVTNCVPIVGVNVDVGKFVLYAFVPVHALVPDNIPDPT